jgi:hypothetical protein
MVAFYGLRNGVETVEGVVGHFKIERRQDRAVSGDDTVGGQEAKSLHVGRGVDEIVHTLVKASMSGSFDERTGQIKIVQYFESARVSQENSKS